MNGEIHKRYLYIDFLRGIAAVGIISIHTAFWAGQSYTPEWFWNITLLLDVPFFFFLSGWASRFSAFSLKKAGVSLLRIWDKWIFFFLLLSLFCLISLHIPLLPDFDGCHDFRELVGSLFFNVSMQGFPVVSGSMWFMPIYFVVIIINHIIISVIQAHARNFESACLTYMWLLLAIFIWVSFGQYFFGLDVAVFCFYSFFWMLGICGGVQIRGICNLSAILVLIICGFLITSYLQDLPFYDIQSAKFPPTIKYGLISLPSIIIAKYLEKYIGSNVKAGIFTHIGQYAIWYFFAQGVGSSINFHVVNILKINPWFLKWVVTFLINIVVTTIVAELLRVLYKNVSRLIKTNAIQRA